MNNNESIDSGWDDEGQYPGEYGFFNKLSSESGIQWDDDTNIPVTQQSNLKCILPWNNNQVHVFEVDTREYKGAIAVYVCDPEGNILEDQTNDIGSFVKDQINRRPYYGTLLRYNEMSNMFIPPQESDCVEFMMSTEEMQAESEKRKQSGELLADNWLHIVMFASAHIRQSVCFALDMPTPETP